MMQETNLDFEALGRMFFAWATKHGIIVASAIASNHHEETKTPAPFFTIKELAERWRISRPTVYTRLQKLGIKVVDLSPGTVRGRKVIPRSVILEVESRQLKTF
jgi:predicted DNA-binding transcriptional regulator AlpA